jgi:hypothetical protein
MTIGCDLRSLEPFGIPLCLRMRNRKLRNNRSDRRSHDPFGSAIRFKVTKGTKLRKRYEVTKKVQSYEKIRIYEKATKRLRNKLRNIGCEVTKLQDSNATYRDNLL